MLVIPTKRRRLAARVLDPKSITSKQKGVDPASPAGSFDMIITHCHESMDRILEFAEALSIRYLYIYSKCGEPDQTKDSPVNVRYQQLPNVGREGHSWLIHMLRSDIEFADWNLFLQGQIEASLEKIEKARVAVKDGFDFLDLSQYFLNGERPPEFMINCYRHIYNHCNWRIKKTDRDQRSWFRYVPPICHFHNKYRFNKTQACESVHSSLRGEFLASGDLLKKQQEHRHDLEELIQVLGVSNAPEVGYMLERAWPSVLGANDFTMLDDER
jgi:hypothetical protein